MDEHILEEPALAIDFIHKLDMRRYHELRKVTSLDEAYELASNFVIERRSKRGTFRVFVADGRSKRGGRSGGRGCEGRGGRSSSPCGDHQPRNPAPYAKVLLTGPMTVQIRMIRVK